MYSEDEMRLLGFMDIARRNGTVENEERAEKMSRTFGGENNWNGNKVRIWDANGMQMGCKWDANGMQIGCKCDANGMQMRCKCDANARQI